MPGETSEVEGHWHWRCCNRNRSAQCTKPWQRKCTIHAYLSLHG